MVQSARECVFFQARSALWHNVPGSRGVPWVRWLVFSHERNMPIEKVRQSGIVTFDKVSEIISWWIENEVGFSMIAGELANIYCAKAT